MSRDVLMRARSVVENLRENVQLEIMRGATQKQAVAAIQLPALANSSASSAVSVMPFDSGQASPPPRRA